MLIHEMKRLTKVPLKMPADASRSSFAYVNVCAAWRARILVPYAVHRAPAFLREHSRKSFGYCKIKHTCHARKKNIAATIRAVRELASRAERKIAEHALFAKLRANAT